MCSPSGVPIGVSKCMRACTAFDMHGPSTCRAEVRVRVLAYTVLSVCHLSGAPIVYSLRGVPIGCERCGTRTPYG